MMNYFIAVLLGMIFCHILDDYVLQAACLSKLKQRGWWKDHAPGSAYKFDYIPALAMHAMSWSYMIMLPISIAHRFEVGGAFFIIFIINALIHAITDHFKANRHSINLVVDQSIHICQIIVTAILFGFNII